MWYDPDDVIMAWDGFILASYSEDLQLELTFKHDLVDVSRQSLQEMFHLLYSQLVTAYYDKNATIFQ